MSEKRFKLVCDLHICAIQDTTREIPTFYNDLGHISSVAPACDLLNELNDECVFLVNQRNHLRNQRNHLREENDVLKQQLKTKVIVNKQYEELQRVKRENEQLKSYIDSMFLGNTHICKEIDVEDAMFYCEKEEKHIYPNCLYHKCFDEENLVEVKEEIRKCNDE